MSLLDEAMAECGESNFSELPEPRGCTMKAPDIAKPLSISDFVGGALREAHAVKKSRIWIDVARQIPECSLAGCFELVKAKRFGELPVGVRPATDVAADVKADIKLGLRVLNNEDGTMDVVKLFYCEGKAPMTLKQFLPMVTGKAYAPHWREGPWAFKKGFQSLLDRLPGYHISWFAVTPRLQLKRADSQKWSVPNEELRAGVRHVNSEAPTDNDENQQWLWIQEQIKDDSGTPLAGWPECKVQRMAENQAKASNANATIERFFPMCVMDLHPIWHFILLPLMFPLLPQYGMLLLGLPYVGKTPTFTIIAMAMGRYWCRLRPDDVTGPPG